MLSAIGIRNYKSIHKLDLELGRVNLFIGENGCGKSNVLEALCLASAAEADKLDNNFLSSRGIRVTSAKLMRSNFDASNCERPIEVSIRISDYSDEQFTYVLKNDNEPYSKWTYDKSPYQAETIQKIFQEVGRDRMKETSFESLLELITGKLSEQEKRRPTLDWFSNFVIYSPENSALRNFYEEGQLEPLGVNGAGLLKLLKVINETDADALSDIKNALNLFGWYRNISIPSNLNKSNDKIEITDRYISSIIDQRSANEGFLFVLFYVALVVSKDTPKVFAIDNIDSSLNPKLCTKIMRVLVELSHKYNKQIFLTTHNPAILDGLDIKDSQQKLFVVSRNNKGYTLVKNVPDKKTFVTSDGENIKFSEAFLRGYLGGLPKGFN
ncbi:AAA family ATPase [Aeromonas veronii]|uniref:AAA family ATPase n=1 Tax=Aeromonas veronii TaxID=654 RepID=UPI0011190B73|nr:AAA family ATPase [Aeromonas veronii]TNJ06346.1 chromosome segregation protein SMC [Aeromonas veronii]